MTIVVPSYQRRSELVRLLHAIGDQIGSDPELADRLDVVVVLDGSTDGSCEALTNLDLPVPLLVHWQPNQGLASARNAGLRRASGEVVLFVDDDMEPAHGWLCRHRAAHRCAAESVVVGPCHIPDSAVTVISQNKLP